MKNKVLHSHKNDAIMYENKKTKRYLKEFFNNDCECEIKLFHILNNLGISRKYNIYLQDLKLVKETPFVISEFSITCLCMDKMNTKVKLNSKKERIGYYRKISVNSDEKSLEFDYNVYTDELKIKQKILKRY